MTAMGTPGFDGCELFTPTNRLLAFFLVEVGLCVGAVAGDDIFEMVESNDAAPRVWWLGLADAYAAPASPAATRHT